MNSCIYISKIFHERKKPRVNRFKLGFYMLYLDLDELDTLDNKIAIFGYNKFNILSFYDDDHFKFIEYKSKSNAEKISKEKISYDAKKYKGKKTKERIKILIDELGLNFQLGKVFLLTNVRNLGYIFNPVSFYFCYDKKGQFKVLFSEVNNTFRQQKMYYILADKDKEEFSSRQKKNYYISPFIDYDTYLHWNFKVPGEKLDIKIDSEKEEKVLRTSLRGFRKKINNMNFFYLILRYPLITLMTIIIIHIQALKLWLKKIPYAHKDETDEKIVKSI